MKRQLLFTLMVLLVLSGAFAGGSGEEESMETSEQDVFSMAPEDIEGTITYWSWMPRLETQYPFLREAWNEKYPNIELVYERQIKVDHLVRLRTAMLGGGGGPDVFAINLGNQARPYVDRVVPLADFAEQRLGSNWEDNYLELAVDWAKEYGEDLPFMPVTLTADPMLLADAGFINEQGGSIPSTYQQTLDVLGLFDDVSGVLPHVGAGLQEEDKTNVVFFTLSEQIEPGAFVAASEGERAWTDDVFVTALERFQKMMDDGFFPEDALTVPLFPDIVYDSFINNVRFPMVYAGSYLMGEVVPTAKEARGTTDRSFGIAPIPNMEGPDEDPVVLIAVDQALAIPREAENPELAWLFIEFMATDYQEITARLMEQFPAQKGVGLDGSVLETESEKRAAETVTNLFFTSGASSSARKSIEYPELARAIYENVQGFLLGQSSIEQALSTIESASQNTDR